MTAANDDATNFPAVGSHATGSHATGFDVAVGAAPRFLVLGPLELVGDDGSPVRLPGKVRTLLAALLCRPNVPVPVDKLAIALWEDEPPPSAANSLRVYVHQLRRVGGLADRIDRLDGGVRIVVRPGELDATRFTDLADRGRAEIAAGRLDAGGKLLEWALAHWRGPAYGGQDTAPMVREEAARLNDFRITVAEERIEAELELGRIAEMAAAAAALVAEYPYRENSRALLMTALHRLGRSAEALEVFQEGRRRLAVGLGLTPGPRLRRLELAILTGTELVAPDSRIGTVSPVGTDSPIGRVSPVGADSLVAPRESVPGVTWVCSTRPSVAGTFTGRSAELARLDALFRSSDDAESEADVGAEPRVAYVCVISGPSGVGKTGLALRWARRRADWFPDGQLYVDLRDLAPADQPVAPSVVLSEFLRAFGLSDDQIPVDPDERATTLRSALAGRRMLLVVDNAASSAQVRPLLPGVGGARMLVTASRRLDALVAADGAVPIQLTP